MHIVTDEEFNAFLQSGATVAPVLETPETRDITALERELSTIPASLRHIDRDGSAVYEVNGEVFVSLPRGDDLAWWLHLPAEICAG